MKYLFILSGVVCLSFMLLPACAPQPEPPAEPAVGEATNREADIKEIESLLETYLSSQIADDLDGFLSIWTDDVIWMPPNGAIIKGKEGCRQFIQPFFDNYVLKQKLTFEEIEVSEKWAFARGNWEMDATPEGEGEKLLDNGKFVFIVERQSDGSWKFSHDIWNSDNAAPGELTS